jgi:predicted TIM-barrel fold metal-dependent hydrolase
VFVEVNVNKSQWLEEAAWVQRIAESSGGSQIGAIVAAPPVGFGSVNVSVASMAAELDKLAALPLVHGVRPPVSWATLTDASFSALVAHTQLLQASTTFDCVH